MPIFESDEEITEEEMERQQQALDEKVRRVKARKLFEESFNAPEG